MLRATREAVVSRDPGKQMQLMVTLDVDPRQSHLLMATQYDTLVQREQKRRFFRFVTEEICGRYADTASGRRAEREGH